MSTTTADQSPAAWDIKFTPGNGIAASTVVSVAGTAVDWTGATHRCVVRRGNRKVGTVVASTDDNTVTITADADGRIHLTIAHATTAAWDGDYPFSITSTFTGDEPLDYVAGTLRGDAQATHS